MIGAYRSPLSYAPYSASDHQVVARHISAAAESERCTRKYFTHTLVTTKY